MKATPAPCGWGHLFGSPVIGEINSRDATPAGSGEAWPGRTWAFDSANFFPSLRLRARAAFDGRRLARSGPPDAGSRARPQYRRPQPAAGPPRSPPAPRCSGRPLHATPPHRITRLRGRGKRHCADRQLGDETAAVREALGAIAELGTGLIGAGHRRGFRRAHRGHSAMGSASVTLPPRRWPRLRARPRRLPAEFSRRSVSPPRLPEPRRDGDGPVDAAGRPGSGSTRLAEERRYL